MEIYLDCLPCALRQVLEASRMATDKKELQAEIMTASIKQLTDYENHTCAPDIVRDLHQVVKAKTGVGDPYRKVKDRDIAAAEKLVPFLKKFLKEKENDLYWALKIAATGNILDAAIYNNLHFEKCIEDELNQEFACCDTDILKEKLKKARRILIIGDNAGETVFDRILLEHLKDYEITYAVRSMPIINDATVEDAHRSGLDDFAKIISTGCNAPGAFLRECSQEFLDELHHADIVISKGQGNFEALSDEPGEIFFLLKAKCPMIAEKLNVALKDYVFQYRKTV